MINDKLIEIIKELKKKSKTDSEIIVYLTGYKVATFEIKEHLAYYYKNDPFWSEHTSESKQNENILTPKKTKPVINDSFVLNSSSNSSKIKEKSKVSKKSDFKMIVITTIVLILAIGLLIFFLITNTSFKDISDKNNDFNSIDVNNFGNTDLNLTNLDVNINFDVNNDFDVNNTVDTNTT